MTAESVIGSPFTVAATCCAVAAVVANIHRPASIASRAAVALRRLQNAKANGLPLRSLVVQPQRLTAAICRTKAGPGKPRKGRGAIQPHSHRQTRRWLWAPVHIYL